MDKWIINFFAYFGVRELPCRGVNDVLSPWEMTLRETKVLVLLQRMGLSFRLEDLLYSYRL